VRTIERIFSLLARAWVSERWNIQCAQKHLQTTWFHYFWCL